MLDRGPRLVGFLAAAFIFAALPARAEEPVFEIEMKDGAITPLRLEVPAKTRFRLS